MNQKDLPLHVFCTQFFACILHTILLAIEVIQQALIQKGLTTLSSLPYKSRN